MAAKKPSWTKLDLGNTTPALEKNLHLFSCDVYHLNICQNPIFNEIHDGRQDGRQ